eukprot:Ihof_evm11s66 gene=Ihof_evmTU11s66
MAEARQEQEHGRSRKRSRWDNDNDSIGRQSRATNVYVDTTKGAKEQRYISVGQPCETSSRQSKHRITERETPRPPSLEDIDWERLRGDLDFVFFGPGAFIQVGTPQYDDFWKFLRRYQQYSKIKAKKDEEFTVQKTTRNNIPFALRDFPATYDKRYRVNCGILTQPYPMGRGLRLTESQASKFRDIISSYEHFCQVMDFKKLVKIGKDRQALPIATHREEIVEAVRQHQVVVVAGDTGCGKSTQLPQYLLDAGFSSIAITQPRRIACIALAKRVAFETLNAHGTEIAYQIRFEGTKTQHTRVLFLTEGLLLRQIASDPTLSQYNVIVMDEVHERNMHCDFLLGVMQAVLSQRPELKLILMSATINVNLFSGYFDNAPIIQVPGRLYPIDVEYIETNENQPPPESGRLDVLPYLHVLETIDAKYPATERGDVLVFLSGLAEISTLAERVQEYANKTQRWIVLPLHSSLSFEQQDKVFDIAPEGVRKCIISTNIAETSVTIDGVRFVIDSGKAKEMGYDSQANMLRLQECWISRASAEQRKGRAGRTGPGHCFRLYDRSEYNHFDAYSTPEIRRVPIQQIILQMKSLAGDNDVDPRHFNFIEKPAIENVEIAMQSLIRHGALDATTERITVLGQVLTRLPLDVSLGKMLVLSSVFQVSDIVLTMAALLSVQSPFTRTTATNMEAQELRHEFDSPNGDPFTLLNAYDAWIQVKADRNQNSRKWCRRHSLEEQRFYEVSKLKRQFEDLMRDNSLNADQDRSRERRDKRKERFQQRQGLVELKREREKQSCKRKVLRLDIDWQGDNDDEADKVDIRDIDFQLSNDIARLQAGTQEGRGLSEGDIHLLKLIIGSGMYPNMAIADVSNTVRRSTEYVFHTCSKPLVTLHPTCVYYGQCDMLKPTNKDAHELLSYVSLLETSKPFLCNVMRVPALQSLMLFSRSIDTTADCGYLVVDDWLEITLPSGQVGVTLLCVVIRLRRMWEAMVVRRLQKLDAKLAFNGASINLFETPVDLPEEAQGYLPPSLYRVAMEKDNFEDVTDNAIGAKLVEFLDSPITYKFDKVKQTEYNDMYHWLDTHTEGLIANPLKDNESTDAPPSRIKGGFLLTDYLRAGCLRDRERSDMFGLSEHMSKHWLCTICNKSMIVNLSGMLEHQQICVAQT